MGGRDGEYPFLGGTTPRGFWCIWGFSRVSRLYIHRRILVRTFANPGFSRDSASDNGWCSSVSVKKNDATSADAPEPIYTHVRDRWGISYAQLTGDN
jgi:hypothetical protein